MEDPRKLLKRTDFTGGRQKKSTTLKILKGDKPATVVATEREELVDEYGNPLPRVTLTDELPIPPIKVNEIIKGRN